MPATAASLSQSESPENPPNLRRPLVGWICAVGLVVLFAVSMMLVPPVTNAAKALPTPEWALFFGRFHPIAVHLPVGVLIMAAFMEALVMLRFPLGQAVKGSVGFVMGFGAFGAIVAVVFGILLSREGGYKGGMFAAHQTLGIATVVGSLLALIFKQISEDSGGRIRFVYRGLLFLTLGIMSVGAHFGGNMVHGSDYLLEYAPKDVRNTVRTVEAKVVDLFAPAAVHDEVSSVNADNAAPEPAPVGVPAPAMVPETNGSEVGSTPASPTPAPAPAPAVATADAAGSPTFYAAVVAPLMEAKCNTCHNADKSKGDLRLDNHEAMLKGGENGDNVVAGDPEKSLLVARMKLPVDHDDHMPPENKDQPTVEEIELVAIWVKAGASKDLKVADANVPDNLKPALQTLLSKAKGGSGGSMPPVMLTLAEAAAQAPAAGGVDPAVAEAMKKINGSGASLAPVAQNAKELRFTALNVARDYNDANLKELESIGGSLVALDLARTKVTDAGLAILAKMTNLKELHLENTAVTDAAGASLKGLAKLEYLNLYGTKVTDKILVDLEGLKALKSLYLWQTGVTEPAAEAFRAKRPGLLVNIGWSEKDNAKVVAAAPAPAPTPAPAPEKPAAPAPAAASAGKADPNAKIYADIVAPILAAKCNSCHGSEKSKGKLRMHTFADLLKGGGDGATTVIASNAKESLLLVRSKLPLDDDDHMPPSDEPQLTKEEIALLEWWVAEGASETLTLAAAKKTPEIEGFANAYLAAKKPVAAPAPAPVAAKVEPKAPAPAPAPAPTPAPAKPEAAPVAVATAGKALDPNAKIYDELVAPILAAKCNACHGTDKSKGKLKMHTFADLLKGGSDGATTVIAGNTKDSLLLVRAKLPKEDDEHMPPSDEPQLSKEELAFLEWWIAEGASESLTFANAKKTPEIETIAKALYAAAKPAKADGGKKTVEKPKAKPLTDAEKKTVAEVAAKITALNASMMAVSLDSEQLRLGTVNAADKFGDKELALLAPVNQHLIWVDLARTKVTDSGLAMVAGMSNLERLHLENTAITDAGLDHLAKLGKLEYLNLYGTKVTDAGLAKLAGAKSLKKLFVWQTGATREGAKKLEAQIPGLVVNVGLSEAEIAKLIEAAQPPPKPAEAPKPAPAPAKPEEKKPEAKKPETPAAAPAPAKPAEAKPAEVKKPDAAPVPAPAPKPEEKKPDAPPAAPAPAADANKK
ncbi:c-type cytochrome domain-containing protein [Verrucomicrobium sp. BvORR106]|uniref:c-type cytochrome domain-containing protein n=1 Tax=Verrucomicrobium sp. BvORR106 TaxID=1403819 RepID=UPI00056F18B1|nr:c-type cytochrome domain-containing protein [Verrucomicrobium sp. BvORR106]